MSTNPNPADKKDQKNRNNTGTILANIIMSALLVLSVIKLPILNLFAKMVIGCILVGLWLARNHCSVLIKGVAQKFMPQIAAIVDGDDNALFFYNALWGALLWLLPNCFNFLTGFLNFCRELRLMFWEKLTLQYEWWWCPLSIAVVVVTLVAMWAIVHAKAEANNKVPWVKTLGIILLQDLVMYFYFEEYYFTQPWTGFLLEAVAFVCCLFLIVFAVGLLGTLFENKKGKKGKKGKNNT